MLDEYIYAPVLFAWLLDGKGGGQPLQGAEIEPAVSSESLTWVHLDAVHSRTALSLGRLAPELDKLIISALMADETRPRLAQFGDGALIILRGVNLNPGAEPDDMVSIRLWVDAHGIISLQRRNILAVSDLQARIQKSAGPRSPGDFVALMIHTLLDRIEPALDELEQDAESIEGDAFKKPDISLRQTIVNLRQQAIAFRRYLSPQRDVTGAFALSDLPWLGPLQLRDLHESHDRLTRYVEDLNALRDRAQIVQDELGNHLAEQLNKNIFVLSIVSAIFMPLSFIAGLFGMNVGGIPGAHDGNAFAILGGLSALIIMAQIIIFKRWKWF